MTAAILYSHNTVVSRINPFACCTAESEDDDRHLEHFSKSEVLAAKGPTLGCSGRGLAAIQRLPRSRAASASLTTSDH